MPDKRKESGSELRGKKYEYLDKGMSRRARRDAARFLKRRERGEESNGFVGHQDYYTPPGVTETLYVPGQQDESIGLPFGRVELNLPKPGEQRPAGPSRKEVAKALKGLKKTLFPEKRVRQKRGRKKKHAKQKEQLRIWKGPPSIRYP